MDTSLKNSVFCVLFKAYLEQRKIHLYFGVLKLLWLCSANSQNPFSKDCFHSFHTHSTENLRALTQSWPCEVPFTSKQTLIFSSQFPLATYHRKIALVIALKVSLINSCVDELPETCEAASIELVLTMIPCKRHFLTSGSLFHCTTHSQEQCAWRTSTSRLHGNC